MKMMFLKRLRLINWLESLILLTLSTLVSQLKIKEMKRKVPNYDKYITTNDFNNLTKKSNNKTSKLCDLIRS